MHTSPTGHCKHHGHGRHGKWKKGKAEVAWIGLDRGSFRAVVDL